MEPAVRTINGRTFGFSADGIKRNYPTKEDFVNAIMAAHPDLKKAEYKKVFGNVWDEAHAVEIEDKVINEGAE